MTAETVFIWIGVGVVLVSVAIYLRGRRGGAGPVVGYIPKPFRGVVNAWFGVMRWPIPFDGDGQLIPVEKRERP